MHAPQLDELSSQLHNHCPLAQLFLPLTSEMTCIFEYFSEAALVESFDKPIKMDDVSSTLAHEARRVGSWTMRELAPREFFVLVTYVSE